MQQIQTSKLPASRGIFPHFQKTSASRTHFSDLPSYPHLAGFSRIFRTLPHPARISYVKPYSHIFKIIKHFTPCVNFILFRMIECDKIMFYTPGFVYSSCVLLPSSSANFDSYVRIN